MTSGILTEYRHCGRSVQLPYYGPIDDAEYENVLNYYKWLWERIRQGGLPSYSYRQAHTRWHLTASGGKVRGIFEDARDSRSFYSCYSKPRIFMAVNPELVQSMRGEVNKNDGPPHQLEMVTEANGLENMKFYKYVQLDGTTPNSTRVRTWWPGHVYFDYAKFLQDNQGWTMDCSVMREKELNRKRKPNVRKGRF